MTETAQKPCFALNAPIIGIVTGENEADFHGWVNTGVVDKRFVFTS